MMSKWTQKESGEERVTAKSRPLMNLITRSKAPPAPSSTASESQGKTRYERQTPLSPKDEKYCRTVRPVVCCERSPQPVVYADSSNYSEWNVDKAWSSQEWKSDELLEDRMGDPLLALSERINSLLKTMMQNQNCR